MTDDIIHCRTHGWNTEVQDVLQRLDGIVETIGNPTDFFRHWLIDHAGARDRRRHLEGSISESVTALRRLEADALARQLATDS